MSAECKDVLNRSWNYEIPLVFSYVVPNKMLGVRRARGIRQRIIRRMNLWERVIHAGIMVDTEAEGAVREFRASRRGEEEDEAIPRS